ncbi:MULTISPECIES: DUF433 domain-containing protein [unclassified Flavobacterium]|uniref:DUF433 domain-containing protein n=1 Tax=unclassified Flavobacterium TaxID=196869 RepID=UPI0018E7CDF0|nr:MULTISPECIES: DUF433 domain-containing protein [unclassified Flavobacterium]MBJ2125331.1 DUF433 domain-containing protein [Flavobacterium sp. IB48]
MENNWQNLISINQDVRFGKPIITGTRICVSDILSWLSTGMSFEEIIEDFPELKKEHILAALSFAANRENITKIIAA